jgi:hypothetical protein
MRVGASTVLLLLLVRAALPAVAMLRYWRSGRASEGQLLLERRLQLATALLRVAGVVAPLSLLLFVLAADKLHHGIRGAMCAYGVFASTPLGFSALYTCLGTALAVGSVGALASLEARTEVPTLARPLAAGILALLPLALADWVMSVRFFASLDLAVVASCCSMELAAGGGPSTAVLAGAARSSIAILATFAIVIAVGVAIAGARKPRRSRVFFSAALSTFAALAGGLAIVVFVAPHVFEVPNHPCPFCLLRGDVYGVGYPLFFAIFYATTWALATLIGVTLAARAGVRGAFAEFARGALARTAIALGASLVIGVAPVLHYWLKSNGTSLFP